MAEIKKPKGSPDRGDQDEEIDMGVFLTLIGRGISNMFNFIKHIFSSLFHALISFLVFIRANFTILFLATIIAGVLGSVYQYIIKDKVYQSSMTVQPNFGSTVQLYKNIDLYASLIKQKDYERLSGLLKISIEEAQSLKDIKAIPYDNESQSVLSYMDFVSSLDSSATDLIKYEDFRKGQADESYKYHVISVNSKDKYIFNKLEEPIIASVIKNDFYNQVKKTSYLNLISRKKALESSMSELDSLRDLYKKVLLAESLKENSGTNIFMSEVGASTKEMVVFDMYMEMNQQLIEVNDKLTRENEVINVLSNFNPVGMKVKGWYRNYALVGFLGGFVIALLALLGIKLNQSLKKYADSIQKQTY